MRKKRETERKRKIAAESEDKRTSGRENERVYCIYLYTSIPIYLSIYVYIWSESEPHLGDVHGRLSPRLRPQHCHPGHPSIK